MTPYRVWWLAGLIGLLTSCGGDDSGTGPVAGPSPILQVNCPGSGTGAGFATPDARFGSTFATTGTGRVCSLCESKSRTLQGVPSQGDNSVGDTKISNSVDCGSITITAPPPTVIEPTVVVVPP